MNGSAAVLIGVAGSVVGLVAYAVHQRRQRMRRRRVERWVGEYLSGRYGEVPAPLHVNCSDDRLWPVLVDFSSPRTGARHRLRFDCPGAGSSLTLLSEEVESRQGRAWPGAANHLPASPAPSPAEGHKAVL